MSCRAMQGDKSNMMFWVTPVAPGRSRVNLHLATAADLPPLLKLLVRAPSQSSPRSWRSLHDCEVLSLCWRQPGAANTAMGVLDRSLSLCPSAQSHNCMYVCGAETSSCCAAMSSLCSITHSQGLVPAWLDHITMRSTVFDGDNVFLAGQDANLAQQAQHEGATWRE